MFSSLLSSGKKTTLEKNVCNSTAFQACSGPLQHFTVKKFAIGNEANHALRRVCKIRCQPTMRMEEKPKRVAIAGAGIAGLSAALALLNTPSTGVEEITLYEPRTTTDFGQGAALNINGAAAILLGCYNVPLWKIANPMEKVVAKTVFGGNVFTVDVGEAVKASPEAQKALVVDGRPTFMTVMRDQFQQQLIDAIEQKVTFCRGDKYAVQDVQSSSSGSSLVLEDGSSTDEYDLVIGADGIRSQLRGYVAGQLKPPSYTRLRVQWAVAPRGSSSLPTGIIEQWFGDGCYTLRYAAGPESSPTEMLAISFYDKSQVSENVGYDKADLKQEVKRRLEKAKMPEQVMKVFHRAERFIETGVYEHDILKSWSRDGNCTLIGDAGKFPLPSRVRAIGVQRYFGSSSNF